MSEKTGGGVLNVLEFMEEFGGCTIENAVAVVEAGCNEGVDQGFGGSER